jgi:hypothetical protein
MDGNSRIYVVPELTTTFQMWQNLDTNFIGKYIFPPVPVPNEMFYTWSAGKEHLTIPTSTIRFGRAKAPQTHFSRNTTLKGPLNEHALSDFITERQYKLGGSSLSVENQVVEGIASQMELVDEYALFTALSDTTILTHYVTLSGGQQWSDHGNSNPFNDITTMVTSQTQLSPMPPNAAWCSNEVWLQIVNHPDFLARLGLAQDRVMTQEGFLKLLAPYGIEKLYISKAKYNSANQAQTATLTPVAGKHFWIGYITDTPGQMQINGGYKFYLDGFKRVTREYENNPPGNEIVNTDFYDYELLSADVYQWLQNVIA